MSVISKLFRATVATAAVGVFALGATVTGLALAEDKVNMKGFGLGMNVEQKVKIEDIGLTLFPGAQPDTQGEDKAVSMKMWGGDFSFQLNLGTYRSTSSLDDIAKFYKADLARYGAVEECGQQAGKAPSAGAGKEAGGSAKFQAMGVKVDATCDSRHAARGGKALRVGTKDQFRMVALEPKGGAVQIMLLRVDVKE